MLCPAIKSVSCAGFCLCYVQSLVCVMCGIQSVLCEVFCLFYVQSLVSVMCRSYSVLGAVFSLCYVQLVCGVFSLCYVQSDLCLACSVSGSPLKRLALHS